MQQYNQFNQPMMPQYGQPQQPQQFVQQQPMNMYQPQGAPQYYQQQPQNMMPQPQQMYAQPQQMQPQQQPGMAIQIQQVHNALAAMVTQAANQNQVSAHIYTRGSNSQWQDNEFGGAVQVAYAFCVMMLRQAAGTPIQQVISRAVTDAYSVMVISVLAVNPQHVQSLPPQTLNELLQDIPRLQAQLNAALPLIGKPTMQLSIPGYQVLQQSPNTQPLMQGNVPMQQNMMAPSYQQQYGMPLNNAPQQPMQGQSTAGAANLGYSNARPVIPPSGGAAHLGVKPVEVGTLLVGKNRHHDVNELGMTARQVSFGSPAVEPLIKTQPQPQQQQPQFVQQPQQPQQPMWNNGVQESYSTPSLQSAIDKQLQEQYPTDINFDNIMSLSNEEEDAMFNAPVDDNRPMPSMTELFTPTFGANKANEVDPFAFMNVNNDTPAYGNAVPANVVHAQPEVKPALSADGLPDGWLFTEKFYDASSEDFFNLMRKSKRHTTCPWPIGYDRRFCTRLYRYMENGSIEQKIVGVPMDRLKHDISLLDTPSPTDKIMEAERADFGVLNTMSVNEAVKIIKDPATTPEVIDEKLGDKSIYLVDKPIVALSRQEAVLLSAIKIKPLQDNLEKGTHGFETQIREMSLITSHSELEKLLANPDVKALTIESDVPNILELSEAIRNVRHNNLLPARGLRKVTDFMRDTLNTILYADYGYAGELELTDDALFEDELVEFVNYMNQSDDDMHVLDLMHKHWADIRGRLCTLLTGDKLHNAQQQIARRYDLSEEDREVMLNQMSSAVLLENAYSITTMCRSTKQLRIVDNQPAFVTMVSDRPYLHKLMTEIKQRGKATGRNLNKHIIITNDGVEVAFAQAGLGRGDTFPTYYL